MIDLSKKFPPVILLKLSSDNYLICPTWLCIWRVGPQVWEEHRASYRSRDTLGCICESSGRLRSELGDWWTLRRCTTPWGSQSVRAALTSEASLGHAIWSELKKKKTPVKSKVVKCQNCVYHLVCTNRHWLLHCFDPTAKRSLSKLCWNSAVSRLWQTLFCPAGRRCLPLQGTWTPPTSGARCVWSVHCFSSSSLTRLVGSWLRGPFWRGTGRWQSRRQRTGGTRWTSRCRPRRLVRTTSAAPSGSWTWCCLRCSNRSHFRHHLHIHKKERWTE